MRWRGRRQSDNIEERRGSRVGRGMVGGGIGTVVLVLLAMYFGVDPSVVMQGVGTTQVEQPAGEPYVESAMEAEWRQQVAVTLAETEDAWNAEFAKLRGEYREPVLVLFSGEVDSGCGYAEAAMGPFYCSADERVFIDLTFFDELQSKLGAGGDFARAYVVAHEVGHHVQNLLGASRRVQELRQRVSAVEANRLSVRLELQADCYAGLWAQHADRTAGFPNRATSTRRSTRRPRSATTRCKGTPAARSCRIPSRMAVPNSASAAGRQLFRCPQQPGGDRAYRDSAPGWRGPIWPASGME